MGSSDVFAETEVFAANNESLSVDVPSVSIQLPNSKNIEPDPTDDVGNANPENSNVCGVANETILKSELNSFAFPVSLIDRLAAVLPLTVLNLDKLVSDVKEVLEYLSHWLTFYCEISKFFVQSYY